MRGTRKKVLVFNPLKRLIALNASAYAVAKAFDLSVSSIRAACDGTMVSYSGLYFRYVNKDVKVDIFDLDTLTLEDYDYMCGVVRKIYPSKTMSRVGMRYEKRPKPINPYYPFKPPKD